MTPLIAEAHHEWTGQVLFGTVVNAHGELSIVQAGEPSIDLTAEWSTRPFDHPLLWAVRLARVGERHGWAVDLHHHKLYLESRPPEVQRFSISHGLNFLTLQHLWIRDRWTWFALAGVAVAHPENVIRGQRLPEDGGLFRAGYHAAGPVIGGGAGAFLPLTKWLDVSGEVRVTHAWITVDVVEGEARLRNLAVHLIIGPRFRL